MEPSKAGTAILGARRSRHRGVETKGMAPCKKNAARLGAHLVFADESGFQLTPNVRRTWAPRGQTPVFHHRCRRDKLSVISGISVSPQRQRLGLYCMVYTDNIQQEEACIFIRQLLHHLRGQVIVVWDNGPIHKGPIIDALCTEFPRLHLERFPAYAPELNPDEGIWAYLKGKLANGRPDDIEQLQNYLEDEIRQITNDNRILRGCICQSELPPFLH